MKCLTPPNQDHNQSEITPNYYAIIPAEVRYCKDLEPNAKLLYGEITALCNQHGYCWANNRYLANLYDVENRTIQRWLASLQKNNFITVVFKEDDKNCQRLIYLNHAFSNISYRTKMSGGCEKNDTHNNTYNNTSLNPPLSSPPKKSSKRTLEKKSLRSEEEEFSSDKKLVDSTLKPFEILEDTILSPKEKLRLTKEFTEAEVIRAVTIAKGLTIKKSLMGVLLDILKNPQNWEDEAQKLTPQQQAAIEYNAKLKEKPGWFEEAKIPIGQKTGNKRSIEEVTKTNEKNIIENNFMEIVIQNELIQVSLKASDFFTNLNLATKQLNQKVAKPQKSSDFEADSPEFQELLAMQPLYSPYLADSFVIELIKKFGNAKVLAMIKKLLELVKIKNKPISDFEGWMEYNLNKNFT